MHTDVGHWGIRVARRLRDRSLHISTVVGFRWGHRRAKLHILQQGSNEGMADYGQWDGHPHTNKHARPTRFRPVEGVRAIRVSGATYRGCAPVDDVFELVGEPKE